MMKDLGTNEDKKAEWLMVIIALGIAALVALCVNLAFSSTARAQTLTSNMTIEEMHKKTWYHSAYEKATPTTLRQALEAEREMIGETNVGWTMPGSGEVCTALKGVGLPCNYNTRMTLTQFLTLNGKGLFPAAGGTNPYYKEFEPKYSVIDNGFIGRPVQNKMLADAVRRNAKLFRNGDLTAEAVQKHWK